VRLTNEAIHDKSNGENVMKSTVKLANSILALFLLVGTAFVLPAFAAIPPTENGVIKIVLDEYNGYFSARDTLVGLKSGNYEFVVTNKSDKLVGFWLQDGKTQEQLDKFPLEPGETGTTRVQISSNGFRYRCPINPTPWYEVAVE
jgi:hypothetical protein